MISSGRLWYKIRSMMLENKAIHNNISNLFIQMKGSRLTMAKKGPALARQTQPLKTTWNNRLTRANQDDFYPPSNLPALTKFAKTNRR